MLDEELLALLTSTGGLKSIATASGVLEDPDSHEVSPSSGLSDVGNQVFTVRQSFRSLY